MSILSNTIKPFYIQKMLAVNVIVVTREWIESKIQNRRLVFLIITYGVDTLVRNILVILVQCNRLKPTPTCISSLGFSHLYILMLGFIIT